MESGLAGFLPEKRGPKGAHKLTDEIIAFLDSQIEADGTIHATELAKTVETRFGLKVHPRSIERAFERKKKRASTVNLSPEVGIDVNLVDEYERLRQTALAGGLDGFSFNEHRIISAGLSSWISHFKASQRLPPATTPHNPWRAAIGANFLEKADGSVVDLIASMAMHSIMKDERVKHAQ